MRMLFVVWLLLCASTTFAFWDGRMICSNPQSLTCREADPTPNRFVFVLTQVVDPNMSVYLARSDVDGIALQLGWTMFEQTEGNYSWGLLETTLGSIGSAQKLATLHVLASPLTATMPTWLRTSSDNVSCPNQASAPGTDYAGNSGTTYPRYVSGQIVPWDCVYLAKFTTFLNALGTRLIENNFINSVFNVSQTVPLSETNIIGCVGGKFYGGTSYSQVNTSGPSVDYDRATFLAAYQQMAAAYHAAFPGKFHFLAAPVAGLICFPENDYAFYDDLMNGILTSYGREFWVFTADLNAYGSDRLKDYADLRNKTFTAMQFTWNATDPTLSGHPLFMGVYPGNLKRATCNGLAMGATYFEFYAADVLNADATIQGAIAAAHDPTLCNLE